MINAVKVSNSFGEIKIDKERRERRIDPCDAVICSHKLAMRRTESVDYEQAMSDYLKMMGWTEKE